MSLADEQAIGGGERGQHGAVLHRQCGCDRASVRSGRERSAQVVGPFVVLRQIPAEHGRFYRALERVFDWLLAGYDRWYVLAHSQGTVVAFNGWEFGDAQRADVAWSGPAIRAEGAAWSMASIQAEKTAWSMASIKAENTAWSMASVQASAARSAAASVRPAPSRRRIWASSISRSASPTTEKFKRPFAPSASGFFG
jgi:alpha-beta hydrolase superfamily lysophospholipase